VSTVFTGESVMIATDAPASTMIPTAAAVRRFTSRLDAAV
jgi:hypothetical protein